MELKAPSGIASFCLHRNRNSSTGGIGVRNSRSCREYLCRDYRQPKVGCGWNQRVERVTQFASTLTAIHTAVRSGIANIHLSWDYHAFRRQAQQQTHSVKVLIVGDFSNFAVTLGES
jgi:hypothetical protein